MRLLYISLPSLQVYISSLEGDLNFFDETPWLFVVSFECRSGTGDGGGGRGGGGLLLLAPSRYGVSVVVAGGITGIRRRK